MATLNQIKYLELNRDKLRDPILVVGSRLYDFDPQDIAANLKEWGHTEIIGVDLLPGAGVDELLNITDSDAKFIQDHEDYFNTVICMEVLTYVVHPFRAAENVRRMLKVGGAVILSECFVRKISHMPVDYWRFTYDGTKELFASLSFNDERAMMSYTRDKSGTLYPYKIPMPEVVHSRHQDESIAGYSLRRVHRKLFGGKVFSLSRLMPEITIYSAAEKIQS
jgi:hypothetical protein